MFTRQQNNLKPIGSWVVISSPVPHHPAYGFDSVPPSMRDGFAFSLRRYSARGIVHGGSARTRDKPAQGTDRSLPLNAHMLPIVATLGPTSPSGVVGCSVRHGVRTFP